MLPLDDYGVLILDCDGVIFNSNSLKVKAMEMALLNQDVGDNKLQSCLYYFKNNFGKSRFHHIEYFVDKLIKLNGSQKQEVAKRLLHDYSEKCQSLYLEAEMTPGLIQVLKEFEGAIYVASGSEHTELNHVFEHRKIADYFIGIFGSPTFKNDIVKNIILDTKNENVLMIGDAESDFEASNSNNIDFVAYLPYSNVREKMLCLANEFKFPTIEHWSELC